jgi:hypothetical protein
VNDNSIWFGRAGSLQRLWAPTGGILATRDRDTSIFTNKSGGTRTIRSLEGARQYSLNYGALGRANFEYLNQFVQGHMGPGPFVLVDPGRRNMLTVNQSSATSQSGDTRGFTIAAGAGSTLSSVASTWGGMPKVLTWAFSISAPTTPALALDKPSKATGWYGIPVINRAYTFWCTVVGGPISVQLRLDWVNSAGAVIGQTLGSLVSTSTTIPARMFVKNATPPAGAVWVLPYVAPDGSTITAGESLSFLNFMLQEGVDTDASWIGGTGIYPVAMVGMPEKYGFDEPGMLVSPTLILQEIR